MINNLELKLNGELPITKRDLIALVNSWGRYESFNSIDNTRFNKCEPKEKYPLENLDVSQIEDMTDIFRYSYYNGDLSKWDLSNCTVMFRMFCRSKFNNDSLKDWNVSNVKNFEFMFYNTPFNGNISNWDVFNVQYMKSMFDSCTFNKDISNWQFNEKVSCYEIFCNNNNFRDKYNNGSYIPNSTKDFLFWFENNREKMKELNITKEEVLDFFSFDSNLNKDIK